MLAIGREGQEHLELLKHVAKSGLTLLSMNHTLPLLEIIELEDIVFGVFPKVGASVDLAYNRWTKPSVADILDIIVQCLEVSQPKV